jgi:hypothetical protein
MQVRETKDFMNLRQENEALDVTFFASSSSFFGLPFKENRRSDSFTQFFSLDSVSQQSTSLLFGMNVTFL